MTDCYVGWKGWHGADFGRFGLKDALYYAQELHASGIASVVGLKVGELGYGNGAFAGWVRQAGGHWVCREAIPESKRSPIWSGYAAERMRCSIAAGMGSKEGAVLPHNVASHAAVR
jgi:hypothetical protein